MKNQSKRKRVVKVGDCFKTEGYNGEINSQMLLTHYYKQRQCDV